MRRSIFYCINMHGKIVHNATFMVFFFNLLLMMFLNLHVFFSGGVLGVELRLGNFYNKWKTTSIERALRMGM